MSRVGAPGHLKSLMDPNASRKYLDEEQAKTKQPQQLCSPSSVSRAESSLLAQDPGMTPQMKSKIYPTEERAISMQLKYES